MTGLTTCRIIDNEHLSTDFFTLRLEAPAIAPECLPGQFVMLRGVCPEWPYLKRPFSIYWADGESVIEIVYKVVGRATSVMSGMADGDHFEVIGPLGKGFSTDGEYKHVIALAGGIGIPPVGFYCQRYVDLHERVSLVLGAKTREDLLVPVGMVVQGVEIMPYTEDGSKGSKGTVVDGLTRVIHETGAGIGEVKVIACGPRDMLYRVAGICGEKGIACEVSVEEIMACGVGACLSCAVPAAGGGYLHACSDGPVFDSQVIDWDRWCP